MVMYYVLELKFETNLICFFFVYMCQYFSMSILYQFFLRHSIPSQYIDSDFLYFTKCFWNYIFKYLFCYYEDLLGLWLFICWLSFLFFISTIFSLIFFVFIFTLLSCFLKSSLVFFSNVCSL